jgi:hypothetical protein
MNYVPAYAEVKTTVSGFEPENALTLKDQPGRKLSVARSRKLQMVVDDVYAEHLGSRKKFGKPGSPFTGAATCIEYPGLGWQCIATNRLGLLGPNCPGLCLQASYHGLVGHLLCLRVEICHRVVHRQRYHVYRPSSTCRHSPGLNP